MPEPEQSRGAARASEPTEGPSLTFDFAEQIASLRQDPTGKAVETPKRSSSTRTSVLS